MDTSPSPSGQNNAAAKASEPTGGRRLTLTAECRSARLMASEVSVETGGTRAIFLVTPTTPPLPYRLRAWVWRWCRPIGWGIAVAFNIVARTLVAALIHG